MKFGYLTELKRKVLRCKAEDFCGSEEERLISAGHFTASGYVRIPYRSRRQQ